MVFSQRLLLFFSRVTLLFLIVSILNGEPRPQEKEKLLFQEIPVVITASLKEQPITEAPTTITIITAEDIKYSGATNIPDILRRVAGIDVMSITARDQQVGIRGFLSLVNNKLLVLVDGRTVYTELFGMVFWDIFPVGLQEIERIEVVKSPASSIYGANAYSGVINIITGSPEQLQGTTFHVTTDSRNTFIGSIIHSGEMTGKTRYKVSFQWDQTGEWRENGTGEGEKAGDVIRFNALVEHLLGKKGKLVFSGGRGHVRDRKLLSGESIGSALVDDRLDYLQFDFEYANTKFRSFYKSEKLGLGWILTGEKQAWDIATFNAEFLHSFSFGKGHSLVWGANYRYNKLSKNPFILQEQRQNLWAFFLEDELKISCKLRVTLGARYDRHPLVKGHISPRSTIFYSPTTQHNFRLSVAKAYRNPSFVDSYIYFENWVNTTLEPPLPPTDIPFLVISQGNRNLKSEGITAFEFGYHSTWSKHIKLDLNLFYNRYSDFFIPALFITYYEQDEIFPGSPAGLFPKTIVSTYENRGNAFGIGGEINVDFSINDRITGFLNYAFQEITDDDDDPSTIGINEEHRKRMENPRHKFNAGLRFIFKNGFSLNLLGHWVDRTRKLVKDDSGNSFLAAVDDYLIVNARVGYRFWKNKAELALSVFNLFNDKHYEYPSPENLPFLESTRIGRRITLTFEIKI